MSEPYSLPWWTYIDWTPTRPGPDISARYMLWLPFMPVLNFCWTVTIVTDESLYRNPPGSSQIASAVGEGLLEDVAVAVQEEHAPGVAGAVTNLSMYIPLPAVQDRSPGP